MSTTKLPVAQLKAELFKALAHPVRVQALEQIVAQERSVSELATSLGIEISHLSKQLSILRKAGVVDTRREGTTIYYSVRDPRLAEIFAVARELIVANLEVTQGWGSAQLSGAVHELTASSAGAGLKLDSKYGFAAQAGVKINLPMLAAGDVLFLQAAYADGALGYLGWGGQFGSGRQTTSVAGNQL
eukprot:gene48143-58970_t